MSRFKTVTGDIVSVADEHDDLLATNGYKPVRGGRRSAGGESTSNPNTGSTPTQRAQN